MAKTGRGGNYVAKERGLISPRSAKPKHGKAKEDTPPWEDGFSDGLGESISQVLSSKSPKERRMKVMGFKKQFKAIAKTVGAKAANFRSDLTARALYRAMLKSCIDLVPEIERKVYEAASESAVYSIVALYNKINELLLSLRSLDDLEGQAAHISENIITPSFTKIIHQVIAQNDILKSAIKGTALKGREKERVMKTIDDNLREMAKFLTEIQEDVRNRVSSYLLGDLK